MSEVVSVSGPAEAQPRRADRVLGSMRFDWLLSRLDSGWLGGCTWTPGRIIRSKLRPFFTL